MKQKVKTCWCCSSCGHNQIRWSGQCPGCQEWNTLVEEIEREKKEFVETVHSKPLRLQEITSSDTTRLTTHMPEFDRAIGNGLVQGSLTLLGGEPGIGKSTLSLQIADAFSKKQHLVLYISGEESLEQTALRAKRLGISGDQILFLNETSVTKIVHHIETLRPKLVIIDSIQIVYKEEIASSAGSILQVRESAGTFMHMAKSCTIATILIGHVTKSGDIAGPKILEHLVDTVLHFEGDRDNHLRLLRVLKNRFGPTDEVAVFQMKQHGLEEVNNPSERFLQDRTKGSIGSVVVPTLEGSRPVLIETQALVTKTFFPTPSRKSTGIDSNRLALLLAVLEKRAKLPLYQMDVFVSIAGGIRILEPACDLALLLAITSSFANKPFHHETIVIGEVGLTGEIRPVTRIELRIKEAIQMGFSRAIVPEKNIKAIPSTLKEKIALFSVSWVDQAINLIIKP